MKKLLILMLVLGLASSASAAISLDPSGAIDVPAGSYSLNVFSDDTMPYERFLAITDATYGDLTAIAILGTAGGDAAVTSLGAMLTYDSVWSVNAVDMNPDPDPGDIVAGTNHFTATVGFTGADIGQNLTIELLDGSLNVLDSMTYNGIPEPMTIALLGLGGLFLLRRRK